MPISPAIATSRAIMARAGLVAALCVPVVVVAVSTMSSGGDVRGWWLVLADLVVVGAAVFTVTARPVLALCLVLGMAVLQWAVLPSLIGTDPTIVLAVMVFAGLAGRRVAGPLPVLRAAFGASVAALVLTIGREMTVRSWFGVVSGLSDALVIILALLGAIIVPWLTGRYLRQRAELITAGWEQARLLERHRRTELDEARLRERARIAQEMHDSLGHQLSLVALRAGVLELTADSDEASAAAAEIRLGVAEANAQLHAVISVLRPAGPPAPISTDAGPTLDHDLDQLVDRAAAAGQDVQLDREEPSGPQPPGPVAVRRTSYLVVQEGLTNVAKHAPGGTARVVITELPRTTVVTVDSRSPVAAPAHPTVGSGLGLVGLRERIRVLGGTLAAGPSAEGFRLRAVLPHDEPSPPSAAGVTSDDVEPVAGPSPTHLLWSARQAGARRGLRRTALVPAVLAVIIAVAVLALQLATGRDNSLAEAAFDDLELGQDLAAVRSALPPSQMIDIPLRRLEHRPEATCRYYWAEDQSAEVDYFRVCFADGHLVSKTVYTVGRAEPLRHEESP